MDAIECMLSRISVRNYIQGKGVSSEDLEKILLCAQNAPSAMNKKPWDFVVVQDLETLEMVRKVHPYADFIADAGCAVMVCLDTEKEFLNYGETDVALASQNIMLGACSLGYGTCYCGISGDEHLIQEFKKMFNLPAEIKPMGIIALGRAAENKTRKIVQDEKYIHYERW